MFPVYHILFLSFCSNWLLSETLRWDGWGSVWPICHVLQSGQSCYSVCRHYYQRAIFLSLKTHLCLLGGATTGEDNIVKSHLINLLFVLQEFLVHYILLLTLCTSQGKKIEFSLGKDSINETKTH